MFLALKLHTSTLTAILCDSNHTHPLMSLQ